jgi:Flp pilus assembly protein protease CpaA
MQELLFIMIILKLVAHHPVGGYMWWWLGWVWEREGLGVSIGW